MNSTHFAQGAFAAAMAIAAAANASIVSNGNFDPSSQTAYLTSATDLINQGQPTFLSQTVTGFTPFNCCPAGPPGPTGSDTSWLNDGGAGAPSASQGTAFDLDGTWTSTFNLNLSVNTNGYDLTGINTISGWPDQRTDQKYDLSYSTVAAPSTFIPLGTFGLNSPNTGGGSGEISITDTTGVIASHVAAIRFDIEAPGFHGSDETVYREIDAFGIASSPEPASLSLLTLGALGLLARRRHA